MWPLALGALFLVALTAQKGSPKKAPSLSPTRILENEFAAHVNEALQNPLAYSFGDMGYLVGQLDLMGYPQQADRLASVALEAEQHCLQRPNDTLCRQYLSRRPRVFAGVAPEPSEPPTSDLPPGTTVASEPQGPRYDTGQGQAVVDPRSQPPAQPPAQQPTQFLDPNVVQHFPRQPPQPQPPQRVPDPPPDPLEGMPSSPFIDRGTPTVQRHWPTLQERYQIGKHAVEAYRETEGRFAGRPVFAFVDENGYPRHYTSLNSALDAAARAHFNTANEIDFGRYHLQRALGGDLRVFDTQTGEIAATLDPDGYAGAVLEARRLEKAASS